MPTPIVLHRVVAVLTVWLWMAPSHAELALARDKNCLSCHTIERKVIGPAFRDIGVRYQTQPAAQTASMLAQKITGGGVGAWGAVPMPANTQVTAAEAQRLARWILQPP